MKRIGQVALVAAATAFLVGPACRSSAVTSLHLYSWPGLFKPSLIAKFEQEAGCKVVMTAITSNEAIYADLENEAVACDVFTAPSSLVSLMADHEMLEPLDRNLLPNLDHVDPDFLAVALDKTMDHSVPHVVAYTGLAYLKSKVKEFVPTWGMIDRPDLKGRVRVMDDMRQTIGAALKSLGLSLNSTDPLDLAKAREVVLRWKKNQVRFEGGQGTAELSSGRILLAHDLSHEVLAAQAGLADLSFAMPFEGGAIDCLDLVIPKRTALSDLAHAFVNFFQDPAVAAENSYFTGFLCPNKESYAYFDEAARTNPALFLPPAVLAKCEILADLGAAGAAWEKIWAEVKAAK
jgi:spermidine/putrescine transport system substrate-binding protein